MTMTPREAVAQMSAEELASKYWQCSETVPSIRDMSHWQGHGRWQDLNAWFGIGQKSYQEYQHALTLSGREKPVESMLEWGVGGGANLIHFNEQMKVIYGVDISPANLIESARQLYRRGFRDFKPVIIDVNGPERALTEVTDKVDFFLCSAVLQHVSSKELAVKIVEYGYEMLEEEGISVIQVRYGNPIAELIGDKDDYLSNICAYTMFGQDEFKSIAERIGFEVLDMTIQPDVKYAVFYLKKPPR